ncbi:MAG: BlaI/MecI/CopY family transcriptional regulator [Bacteroidia bacterium]
MQTRKPTDGELEILQILWKTGPATVRQVNDALSQERLVGYTTTLKLMQIMHDKGLLARELDGKTHIYRALVSEDETRQQLVDRLLDSVFQGSAMKLALHALGSRPASQEELDEIRRFLDGHSDIDTPHDDPQSPHR